MDKQLYLQEQRNT